jgi:PqqD family protein of HPr-rel-A system
MSAIAQKETSRGRSTPTAPDDAQVSVQTPMRTGRPKRREDLTIHELDGEALIFDPRTADTHRLNATALFIWHRLDGEADIEAISGQLCRHYDVGAEEAGAHVSALVATLGEKGLLDLARLNRETRRCD